MSDTNQDKGPLDLTVAKCLIGQRSISRAVYDKTLEDLIQEVEKLREEIDGDNEDLERMFALKASKVRELEARNELSRIAYNQIEERIEKLKAENAELKEALMHENKQLETATIKHLKAQLSESQNRVKELEDGIEGLNEDEFGRKL